MNPRLKIVWNCGIAFPHRDFGSEKINFQNQLRVRVSTALKIGAIFKNETTFEERLFYNFDSFLDIPRAIFPVGTLPKLLTKSTYVY